MDETTLDQFYNLMRRFRRAVYSIKRPEMTLPDLDSTLLETYGNQEGEDFNYHYQSHGYHPLVCYDGISENPIILYSERITCKTNGAVGK